MGFGSSRIAMCVVEPPPPPPHEVIPKVFCVLLDMSALTKRLPGGDVVSRITTSAPGGAVPLTDGVCDGVPVAEMVLERLGVPDGVAGGEGVMEDVAEGREPGEGVEEAVGIPLGEGSTTPFTSRPTP